MESEQRGELRHYKDFTQEGTRYQRANSKEEEHPPSCGKSVIYN